MKGPNQPTCSKTWRPLWLQQLSSHYLCLYTFRSSLEPLSSTDCFHSLNNKVFEWSSSWIWLTSLYGRSTSCHSIFGWLHAKLTEKLTWSRWTSPSPLIEFGKMVFCRNCLLSDFTWISYVSASYVMLRQKMDHFHPSRWGTSSFVPQGPMLTTIIFCLFFDDANSHSYLSYFTTRNVTSTID